MRSRSLFPRDVKNIILIVCKLSDDVGCQFSYRSTLSVGRKNNNRVEATLSADNVGPCGVVFHRAGSMMALKKPVCCR